MKTLKLEESTAKRLYKNADKEFRVVLEESFGKEFFSEKITDKIQDLSDIFNYLGVDESDVYIFPKNTKDKFQRYINACAIIPKIVEVYNEKEELDWSNTSIYKYLPYYKKVGSGWVFSGRDSWGSFTYGSAAHHFKRLELLQDACKKFDQVYVDFYSYKG